MKKIIDTIEKDCLEILTVDDGSDIHVTWGYGVGTAEHPEGCVRMIDEDGDIQDAEFFDITGDDDGPDWEAFESSVDGILAAWGIER